MLTPGSGPRIVAPHPIRVAKTRAGRQGAWLLASSGRFVVGVALGVGIVSFLATELMHSLLVPDLGRHRERLLAESLSAFIVTGLIAKLAHITLQQHRLTVARMQVIAEMNHHIRNALTPISLSAHVTDNQQLIRAISDGVDRIDWALREILPREVLLHEGARHELGYFQARGANTNEQPKSSLR